MTQEIDPMTPEALAALVAEVRMRHINGSTDPEVPLWCPTCYKDSTYSQGICAAARLADVVEEQAEKFKDWQSHLLGHPGWVQPFELSCEFCRLEIRVTSASQEREKVLREALAKMGNLLAGSPHYYEGARISREALAHAPEEKTRGEGSSVTSY